MRYLFALVLSLSMSVSICHASMLQDFDSFPTTVETPGNVPGAPTGWQYSSNVTNNTGFTESLSSGWRQYPTDTEGDGWNWIFDYNRNGDCASHLGGGDTYGYLAISDSGHSGKALKYHVIGGLEFTDTAPCTGSPLGTELYNLESYAGVEDDYTGADLLGHMYIYFRKIAAWGSSRNYNPFSQIGSSNRMSFYIKMPDEVSNGTGGWSNPPEQTFQIGTFIDPDNPSGHYYQNVLTQGGGWTKVTLDETPNGTNGALKTSVYQAGFFSTLWEFYLTTLPYSGAANPVYDIYLDEVEFSTDSYTDQNNISLSNIAIMYKDSDDTWEVSFNDTFKTTNSFSTWEMRYSTSGAITNENWSSATPVEIQADTRYDIIARTNGQWNKHWPDYHGVWAKFKLTTADTAALSAGQTIYFAIKDISQNAEDLTLPIAGIGSRFTGSTQGGRPFNNSTYLNSYAVVGDWATISAALPLIKRVSYTLAGEAEADTTAPTITSASVNGSTVTVNFDEPVVTTGYDAADFNIDCSTAGTDIALTSPSGSGSSRTFTAATPVAYGDTCNLDYVGGTDDIEDVAGNDLATFSDTAVTNNTAQVQTHNGCMTVGGYRFMVGGKMLLVQ